MVMCCDCSGLLASAEVGCLLNKGSDAVDSNKDEPVTIASVVCKPIAIAS